MARHGLTVRGDSLYCPLAFSLDPYWWCEPNCPHCYLRGLNAVWGETERPFDVEGLDRKLTNGPKNPSPKTPLAWCLKHKKTLRVGNKADPYQPIEYQSSRSLSAIKLLVKHQWSFVIQTRFTRVMRETSGYTIWKATKQGLVTLLPIISPGLEKDWEELELKRTTPIPERLKDIKYWLKRGTPLGVQGEPFIPGYHTPEDFENTIRTLKETGVKSYNTYNFHFTPHVAKRLVREVPSADIEKIWYYNQDKHWRPILQQLLGIANKYDMILGCPDFVNSGKDWKERANTCCGISVPNPCFFNTHFFKQYAQEGTPPERIIDLTWDNIGDFEQGKAIVQSKKKEPFYTLADMEKNSQ